MALFFNTSAPANLLKAFKKIIDDGHVVTWSYDSGGDFTHNTDQWRYQAWMRPHVLVGQLAFYILPPMGIHLSRPVYGIYHGRLIESVTTHLDFMFSDVSATALATTGDRVSSAAA